MKNRLWSGLVSQTPYRAYLSLTPIEGSNAFSHIPPEDIRGKRPQHVVAELFLDASSVSSTKLVGHEVLGHVLGMKNTIIERLYGEGTDPDTFTIECTVSDHDPGTAHLYVIASIDRGLLRGPSDPATRHEVQIATAVRLTMEAMSPS